MSLSAAAKDRMLAASVTSSALTLTFLRCAATALRSFAAAGSRAVAITCHPSAAYCLANSRPIPRLAPVISTVAACAVPQASIKRASAVSVRLIIGSAPSGSISLERGMPKKKRRLRKPNGRLSQSRENSESTGRRPSGGSLAEIDPPDRFPGARDKEKAPAEETPAGASVSRCGDPSRGLPAIRLLPRPFWTWSFRRSFWPSGPHPGCRPGRRRNRRNRTRPSPPSLPRPHAP